MATSLLALLDDIATVLDDVAVMTKVATKKTAGVLGDDLALNAQQVAGVARQPRAAGGLGGRQGLDVQQGDPGAHRAACSAPCCPGLVIPLLMIGGAFLCFEGVEKLAHKLLHSKAEDDAHHAEIAQALTDPSVDLVALEQRQDQGRDPHRFHPLGRDHRDRARHGGQASAFATQVGVLVAIALVMTVGVYGLVAGIVKLDDAGLYLSRRERERLARAKRTLGRGILRFAPWLMKFLSIAGTAAMFLVGGGILTHNVPPLHHAIEAISPPGVLGTAVGMLADFVVGVIVGAIVLGAVVLLGTLRRKPAAASENKQA